MTHIDVAFIGLGVMGYPMAGHLSRQGHRVSVFNRSAAKAEAWCKEYEGVAARTPGEAAAGANIVFICVGNDDDVRAVVYGDEGILSGMNGGSVLVDHTTTSADLSEELAVVCAEREVQFMDAPVSGGQAGAENGALTVMCGGSAEIFAAIEPVVASYAKQCSLLGPVGQGQRCKMVNQVCIAGVLQGLSEGLLLAEHSGLDIEQVVDTLKQGAAGSWQMTNRACTMSVGEFDFGFAINWMRKDLGFALTEAKRSSMDLPLVRQVDAAYYRLQEEGHGSLDTSALVLDLRNQRSDAPFSH